VRRVETDMPGDAITGCKVTGLKLRARRKSGAVIHRFVAISSINRVWNGDGLGMLMLGMVLLGMDLLVFLEILGTLESFLTDLEIR
jgi:hypothetical protein